MAESEYSQLAKQKISYILEQKILHPNWYVRLKTVGFCRDLYFYFQFAENDLTKVQKVFLTVFLDDNREVVAAGIHALSDILKLANSKEKEEIF